MFLVDTELKRALQEGTVRIEIDEDFYPPFNPLKQIGSSSIDLRLGRVIRKYKQQVSEIDLTQKDETELIEIPPDKEMVIGPGEFFLGVTVERITLPANMVGIISARSSIARLGLSVVSQIFMHAGHSSTVALQLSNMTGRPIKIKPLLPICQIILFQSTSYAENPYKGKYSNESTIPFSSGIGVELGLEKEEQLIKSTDIAKFPQLQELQKDVKDIKNRLPLSVSSSHSPVEVNKDNLGHARSINLLTTVFLMVIAGCFPIIIQDFHLQPFPSVAFIISTILVIFCVACLVIINWKR